MSEEKKLDSGSFEAVIHVKTPQIAKSLAEDFNNFQKFQGKGVKARTG